MSQPLLIRPATLPDLPQISSLGTHVFTNTFGYSLPPEDLSQYLIDTYSLPSLTSDLHDPNTTVLVATSSPTTHSSPDSNSDSERHMEILGFAQLRKGTTEPCLKSYEKEGVIELQRLYVCEEAQGRGVGRTLVVEIENIAKPQGYKILWLGVWEENLRAHIVYEKMGFRKCGTHDFVIGSCVQTDWIMRKGL